MTQGMGRNDRPGRDCNEQLAQFVGFDPDDYGPGAMPDRVLRILKRAVALALSAESRCALFQLKVAYNTAWTQFVIENSSDPADVRSWVKAVKGGKAKAKKWKPRGRRPRRPATVVPIDPRHQFRAELIGVARSSEQVLQRRQAALIALVAMTALELGAHSGGALDLQRELEPVFRSTALNLDTAVQDVGRRLVVGSLTIRDRHDEKEILEALDSALTRHRAESTGSPPPGPQPIAEWPKLSALKPNETQERRVLQLLEAAPLGELVLQAAIKKAIDGHSQPESVCSRLRKFLSNYGYGLESTQTAVRAGSLPADAPQGFRVFPLASDRPRK